MVRTHFAADLDLRVSCTSIHFVHVYAFSDTALGAHSAADLDFKCHDVRPEPNYTTVLNFTSPKQHQVLSFPDASGTVISTGNLQDITSLGVQDAPLVARSSAWSTTTIVFDAQNERGLRQREARPTNNTLLVPSSASGILLSTGNLEDLKAESGSMTGLQVKTNLHVQNFLHFGMDPNANGLRAVPTEPSLNYVWPHGNQVAGFARPGRVNFFVHDSRIALEFEPAPGPVSKTISIPGVSGTIVTTGNLEAVTAESGYMTSISVLHDSYLQGGTVVGSNGKTQLALQGYKDRTMVFTSPTGENQHSRTSINFNLLQEDGAAHISFPPASGRVITTGNPGDVFGLNVTWMNVTKKTHMRGPVRVGTKYQTAMQLDGFIQGDLHFRAAVERPTDTYLLPVPLPETWGSYYERRCANVPGPAVINPRAVFPVTTRFNITKNSSFVIKATIDHCKQKCEDDVRCSVLVTSRYYRGFLLSMQEYPQKALYLSALLRKQAYETNIREYFYGYLQDDGCYPGITSVSNETAEKAYPYDFVKYPDVQNSWRNDSQCQQAAAINTKSGDQLTYLSKQWGPSSELGFFSELDFYVTQCNGTRCKTPGSCPVADGCLVLVRSRLTGSYLAGEPGYSCSAYTSRLSEVSVASCPYWRPWPMAWRVSVVKSNLTCAGCDKLNPKHMIRLSRAHVCAELRTNKENTLPSGTDIANISCGSGDRLKVTFAWWSKGGEDIGVCGAYKPDNTPNECVNQALFLTKIDNFCSTSSGCNFTLTYEPSAQQVRVFRWNTDTQTQEELLGLPLSFCAGMKRFVVQGTCEKVVTLAAPSDVTPSEPSAPKFFQTKISEKGTEPAADDMSTVFYLHSDMDRMHDWSLHSECWGARDKPMQCSSVANHETDLHLYMRYEHTRLTFAYPSAPRTQWFPDASGTIITSGNLIDMENMRGLTGDDTWIYKHGMDPETAVTIIDFAAVGSAPMNREDGLLPQYTRADGTPSRHTPPLGSNRRITFPDATGTVITTGNTDDLVYKNIKLEGLDMRGEANFVEGINFGPMARVSGCFNFIFQAQFGKRQYTQLCHMNPTKNNTILLPDASGTIISKGNTLNLPSVGIKQDKLFVGGDATFEGTMQWGTPHNDTSVATLYTWMDGDVSIPLSTAGPLTSDVIKLNTPHMGGLDIAIRHWMTDLAREIPVNVQGGDSYRDVVEGTSRVNQSVCFSLLRQNNVHDVHGLGYYLHRTTLAKQTRVAGASYAAFSQPVFNKTITLCYLNGNPVCEINPPLPLKCNCTDLEGTEVESWRMAEVQEMYPGFAERGCESSTESSCAFDENTSTIFRMPVSPSLTSRCLVGLSLNAPAKPTHVRVYPYYDNFNGTSRAREMLGGVLQGTADPTGEAGWEELYVFSTPPKLRQWNEIELPRKEISHRGYVWLRYKGPACSSDGFQGCGECDVAEWEWHAGLVAQRLLPWSTGERSYFIDNDAVRRHAEGAMVLKCAAQGWYPTFLNRSFHELSIPETSGILLTTGNLQEISVSAGSMTSLGVGGDLHVGENTVLGDAGKATTLEINSVIDGRFPLSFAGSGSSQGSLILGVTDVTMDSRITMPDASGKVITTGSLPSLADNVAIVGETSLRGPVRLEGNVTIGDPLTTSRLEINAALSTAFPLTFSGTSPQNPRITVGVQDPSRERLLVLPDATGTVITTGNLPDVFEDVTFIGEATFRAGARFVEADVVFGERGGTSNLEMNAAIAGSIPLRFEGRAQDGRTLSIAVEEPSGMNVITLPDVSGTVITTGNFPEVLENIRVRGQAYFDGDLEMVGPLITVGDPAGGTRVTVNANIAGRYPLVFGEGQGSGSTTFEIKPPTRENVIAFPDISGISICTCVGVHVCCTFYLHTHTYTNMLKHLLTYAHTHVCTHKCTCDFQRPYHWYHGANQRTRISQ
jgi:hypothetical protein